MYCRPRPANEWEAAAQDAGVPPDGPDAPGFRGISFRFIVASSETVDETLRKAAGGGVTEAAASQWGGYFGCFSDPDGYLWKVASSA